jgi:phospholipid/cholesterol/gamma-HCH transport system permease protein
MITALAGLGRSTVAAFAEAGRVVLFAAGASWACLRVPGGLQAASVQAVLLTMRCAVPVVLVLAPIGAMLALQSLTLMRSFGVERQLAPLAAAVIVRELAPGFAAVVVSMQGGAGIAAELAAMRHAEELDALDVMGVDARGFVAGPRILGAAVAAPLLNALAILMGMAGTYAMAVLVMGVPRVLFLETVWDGINMADLWISQAKTVVFGLGLGAICASAGFFRGPETGAVGVGMAANRAVVKSVVFVLVANYLLNTAIFGLKGGGVEL